MNHDIAMVYSSITGNTAELAGMVVECIQHSGMDVRVFSPDAFCREDPAKFGAVMVGTYTWGSGEIPYEMRPVYQHIERFGRKATVTAVFGTGDSFFAEFCGAVDRFRDMLYVRTNLAAVLKVELRPEEKDRIRCEKLIAVVEKKLTSVTRVKEYFQ